MYYRIDSLGTGVTPTLSSRVFVTYTAKLLNGTVVDHQPIAAQTGWVLGGLILGWQIGLPLIKEGGGITLLVPSSLAYGCNGYGGVPPDSIMEFDIALVDVQ
jgi:FKBP-type peptidyl-prolyl cis-trans isomerase FkpA